MPRSSHSAQREPGVFARAQITLFLDEVNGEKGREREGAVVIQPYGEHNIPNNKLL